MASLELEAVDATYEFLSVVDYNLKRRVVQAVRRRRETPTVIEALRGLDLRLNPGDRIGLVGRNGAGKSTLLAVMAGVLPPTKGRVRLEGRVLALLGGSGAGLSQEATGRENVISMGVQLGEAPVAMRTRLDDIVDFSGLGDRIDHPVYSYSSGMQSRLRFSVLTSLRPDVLLMDEGIGAADAEFAQRASARLEAFMSSVGIFVMASHGDALLRQQCTHGLWLDRGLLAATGPIDEVLTAYHASYTTQVDQTS
jgi:ABC-2 type transport system ATP-binding protein